MIVQNLMLILAFSLPAISNGFFSPEDEAIIKKINNAMTSFTLKFEKLAASVIGKKNHYVSPLSIFNLCTVLHMGTCGETQDELADFLGFPRDEAGASAARNTFANMMKHMQSSQKTKLLLANAIFVDHKKALNDEFVHKASSMFNSDVVNMNFQSPAAALSINNWAAKKTIERVPKIFSESVPGNATMLVAAAMSFSANWTKKFDNSKTTTEYYSNGESTIEVKMMVNVDKIPYYHNSSGEFRVIGIPMDDEYTLFLLKPFKTKELSNVLHDLQPDQLHKIVELAQQNVTKVLYKLARTDGICLWNHLINNELENVGLEKLFNSANFSKIYQEKGIDKYSVNIQHASEAEVNECGFGAVETSTPSDNKNSANAPPLPDNIQKFIIDRPFIFFVYHQPCKSFIYFGQVYEYGQKIN